MTTRPHALYRFWDSADVLLYVGITLNPGERWKQHRADKAWWEEVATVTVETYPDRPSVMEAERTAIIAEGPKYNIVHNAPVSTPRGILQVEGTKVIVTCQACRRPVLGKDGYLWIDGTELAEHEKAWAPHDRQSADPSFRAIELSELMSLPGPAQWRAHHARCDLDPDAGVYSVASERIDTVGKLLDWTAHLMGKSWIGDTNWDDVIRSAAAIDA